MNKSLKALVNDENANTDIGINAYGNRLTLRRGDDILLPGHVSEFIEDGPVKATVWDHTILTRSNWHLTRNTKVRKNFDVVHKVTNTNRPWGQQIEDRT